MRLTRGASGKPGRGAADRQLDAVVAWIRTIALAEDLFVISRAGVSETFAFPFPSLPDARPVRVDDSSTSARVRFIVHAGSRGAPEPVGFRAVFGIPSLVVLERDAVHGRERPLRLGLSPEEGLVALQHVRRSAERFLASAPETLTSSSTTAPRLNARSGIAVAIWTRGRLRGSIVCPPASSLRSLGKAAAWACRDARFERLTSADLDATVFQVTFVHAPMIPLVYDERGKDDAPTDTALFVHEGARTGVYLPEIFNVARHRTLASLMKSVAVDKAGIAAPSEATRFEICAVTEVVESADRTRALLLEGPVARDASDETLASQAKARGEAAADWLAAIQREDGSLPLRVRPSSGAFDGHDGPRMAMTAEGLAAFGVAYDVPRAIMTARRVLAFLERSSDVIAQGGHRLLVSCYVGKAKVLLDGVASEEGRAEAVLRELGTAGTLPTLTAAHVRSFLGSFTSTDAASACERLTGELTASFARALSVPEAPSLAEWAEVAMGPRDLATRVRRWLCSLQLASGAFPNTPASSFVYTRGTGKIFEVLAGDPESTAASDRALKWLFDMQYRADSAFFIPTEHRSHLLGGLRHDLFDTDAWIDSAGHLLLGLARRAR